MRGEGGGEWGGMHTTAGRRFLHVMAFPRGNGGPVPRGRDGGDRRGEEGGVKGGMRGEEEGEKG